MHPNLSNPAMDEDRRIRKLKGSGSRRQLSSFDRISLESRLANLSTVTEDEVHYVSIAKLQAFLSM